MLIQERNANPSSVEAHFLNPERCPQREQARPRHITTIQLPTPDTRVVCGWRDLPPSTRSASRRLIAMVPTSLIKAACSETVLTLIPSSSRPLYGKVIQLSPGSQRVLKKKGGGGKKKKEEEKKEGKPPPRL